MSAPTGTLTSYDQNRVLYKKEMVGGIEIYVYSNNEEDELYDVNFSNVGQNQGRLHIDLMIILLENIYQYTPRINGEKQGDFEPIVKLIAPEKLQLLTYNSTFQIKSNSKINIELASSNSDKNLFSSIDDSNNTGFATKLQLQFRK